MGRIYYLNYSPVKFIEHAPGRRNNFLNVTVVPFKRFNAISSGNIQIVDQSTFNHLTRVVSPKSGDEIWSRDILLVIAVCSSVIIMGYLFFSLDFYSKMS